MALLSPKEFGKLIGAEENNVRVYYQRRKFIYSEVDGKRLIDTELPQNAEFIKIRQGKIGIAKIKSKHEPLPPLPVTEFKKKVLKKTAESNKVAEAVYEIESETKKKKLEKLIKETAILHLKESKMSGDVVPVAPMATIIFQFKQTILTNMKTCCEAILNEFAALYDVNGESMNGEDIAHFRKFFINGLNTAIQTANDNFESDFDIILNDYIDKKSVGERN